MGRFAATTSYPPRPFGCATVVCMNSGRCLPTGSVISSRPSSCSSITPTLASAFVCDAMRKIASVVIGAPDSLSR